MGEVSEQRLIDQLYTPVTDYLVTTEFPYVHLAVLVDINDLRQGLSGFIEWEVTITDHEQQRWSVVVDADYHPAEQAFNGAISLSPIFECCDSAAHLCDCDEAIFNGTKGVTPRNVNYDVTIAEFSELFQQGLDGLVVEYGLGYESIVSTQNLLALINEFHSGEFPWVEELVEPILTLGMETGFGSTPDYIWFHEIGERIAVGGQGG